MKRSRKAKPPITLRDAATVQAEVEAFNSVLLRGTRLGESRRERWDKDGNKVTVVTPARVCDDQAFIAGRDAIAKDFAEDRFFLYYIPLCRYHGTGIGGPPTGYTFEDAKPC